MNIPNPHAITLVGTDGVPGGWIAAVSCGHESSLMLVECLSELLTGGVDLLLVDIPVGLRDAASRDCDREARRLMGLRRNSVFPAPLRAMLSASSYSDACAIRQAAVGTRCSKQLYAIMPKIKEVDDFITPELQSRVREGHPELSFTLMNGGCPMPAHKSLPDGIAERRGLLRGAFPDLDQPISAIDNRYRIDVLDAYALLWSAQRLSRGVATIIPSTKQIDARGLRAKMVA